jgi:hypothetical protein
MSERDRRSVPPEEYVAPRLSYLETSVFPRTSVLWRDIGSGFVFVEAVLRSPDQQASRAALALYDIDREARRAARIVAGRGDYQPRTDDPVPIRKAVEQARGASARRLLRPAPTRVGGFRLLRSDEGSAEFYLDAYGLLRDLLLNDPLQIILTLASIFGAGQFVVRRISRDGAVAVLHDLSTTVFLEGNTLEIAGQLAPGSTLTLRYRAADGSELHAIYRVEA